MSDILDTILLNTYTVDDAYRRLNLAQECLEDFFYHSDKNQTASITAAVKACAEKNGKPDDAVVLAKWGDDTWNQFQANSFPDALHRIKESVATIPTMTLYVPVRLDVQGIAMLGTWCRQNVQERMLLEVIVDPYTTGGCAFVHNDVYHDFSLHRFFENKRGVVSELLNSYD